MKRIVFLLVLVAAALLALPLYFHRAAEPGYQGWVEADLAFIGADSTGRLALVAVSEGDAIRSGAPLFALEDTTVRAQLAASEARLDAQQAQLRLAVAAQKRPEEIDILKASQRQAEAQLALSVQHLERVRALAEAGTATRASLDTAIAAEAADRAGLDNIRGQIVLASLPLRDEAIRQAEYLVAAARAERDAASDSLARLSVEAPAAGTVQTVYYRAGEVVPAGRPVVALLSPDAIRIRFFVSETRISGFALGQVVRVTCDGCPPTTARISFLSASAEYTPPEIYSLEQRAKLVYRVEAIAEEPGALHPGLPVDVLPLSPDVR